MGRADEPIAVPCSGGALEEVGRPLAFWGLAIEKLEDFAEEGFKGAIEFLEDKVFDLHGRWLMLVRSWGGQTFKVWRCSLAELREELLGNLMVGEFGGAILFDGCN